jgi:hypothetical protein
VHVLAGFDLDDQELIRAGLVVDAGHEFDARRHRRVRQVAARLPPSVLKSLV